MSEQAPTVVIMAGGTGGHIFPGLAAADEFKRRGYHVSWLGTPNSMEAKLVPQHGIDIELLPVTGLRGKGIKFLLQAPVRLTISLLKAMKTLHRLKPVCVVGMGGYVTGPGGIAAWLMNIPLIIHEQNAIAGFTNKQLAKLCTSVLCAFPGAFGAAQANTQKYHLTGNPVRAEISAVPPLTREDGTPLNLLVVGGSRGAQVINEAMPKVLAQCGGMVEVWHQTGEANVDACKNEYLNQQVAGRVEPFISDMATAYRWADLVVCRAGALTVAELAAAGRPSILIPFPWAVDDHQTVNGQYLVDRGAAQMILQRDLKEDKLTHMIVELTQNSQQLLQMAQNAKYAALPHATTMVVDRCLQAAGVEVQHG